MIGDISYITEIQAGASVLRARKVGQLSELIRTSQTLVEGELAHFHCEAGVRVRASISSP